jgi:hypothetical protein
MDWLDWRRISAFVSVSASLGLVPFGAYVAAADDAITPESGSSSVSLIFDAVNRNQAPQHLSVEAERDPSGPVNGSAHLRLTATEVRPAPLAKAEGSGGPAHLSKTPKGCLQCNASDLKSKYTRSCVVFERGTPLVGRRGGTVEERGAPRIALMLGVAF